MKYRYRSAIGFGLVFVSFALGGSLAACSSDDNTATPDAGGADATKEASGGNEAGTPLETGTPGDSGSTTETGGGDDGGVGSDAAEAAAEAGGGDAAGEASAGDAGDSGVALDCPSYCTLIMTNCTGANAQYGSMTECTNACGILKAGALADKTGDTLGCRIYHAGLAASLPNPHCWHAGPYGFGACGAQCDDFCELAVAWCSPSGGFDAAAPPYMNIGQCKTSCIGFTSLDGGAAPGAYSVAGPSSGNTLDCREWHLGKALDTSTSQQAQQIHCNHVGATSSTCM
jgi:hypothetical protein